MGTPLPCGIIGMLPDSVPIWRLSISGWPVIRGMRPCCSAQGAAPRLPETDPPETWIDRLAQLNPGRTLCIVDRDSAQMSCQP